jgi:predicted O-methyltransferase YrrM
MEKERREQEFLASLIYFADVKVCVEIGVAHGSTSLHFCRALTKTGGWLYGYDVWDRHGQKGQFSAFGSKDKVADLLTQKGFVNFSLT